MFDGNWRDAVTVEHGDPSLSFTEGASVRHKQYGLGLIKSTWLQGLTRMLEIEFKSNKRQKLPLNLHSMKVVEDYEE